LCCVIQDHPNRQTYKGLGKNKGTPGRKKDIRVTREKGRRIQKEQVGVDDEDEESMDWRNNVRYLRIN
jgi:Mg-chelatase subunit ChlD